MNATLTITAAKGLWFTFSCASCNARSAMHTEMFPLVVKCPRCSDLFHPTQVLTAEPVTPEEIEGWAFT